MSRLLALAMAVLGGCYRPSGEAACSVRCGVEGLCPSGLACFAGTCKTAEDEVCAALDGGDPDVPPGCFGRSGPGYLIVCPPPVLEPVLALDGTLDTDTDPRCMTVAQPGGSDVCVIAAQRIVVAGQLLAIGARPLGLLGTTSVEIGGALEVAAHAQGMRPAGGDPAEAACVDTVEGTSFIDGGGGGAGGSFRERGGKGGKGNSNSAAGGMPGGSGPVATLRGGCRGGDGGAGIDTAGAGGAGGGAVCLLTGGVLTITGTVNASGGGAPTGARPGDGVTGGAGGGGGGAGGMIVLDARMLAIASTARIFALGGSGGAGGPRGTTQGAAGGDPVDAMTAIGGAGTGGGGSGGDGGGIPAGNAADGATGAGGGGGGGARGWIRSSTAPSDVGAFNPRPDVP